MIPKNIVYLEDVEPPRKTPADASASTESATQTKAGSTTAIIKAASLPGTAKASSGQKTASKRQLSISDMFTKESGNERAKRQKLGGANDTASGSNGAMIKKSYSLGAIPPLNSIPLNLDAFRASLTEEERILLHLELETMGKSWCVLFLSRLCSHLSIVRRVLGSKC